MNDDNEDDLYGDLMEQKLPASASSSLLVGASAAKKQKRSIDPSSSTLPSSVKQQNNESGNAGIWKQRVEELANENNILKRNIGTLYRTAKKEIERKDKEIQRLTEELERKNVSSSS